MVAAGDEIMRLALAADAPPAALDVGVQAEATRFLRMPGPDAAAKVAALTPRQRQVLQGIVQDKPNKIIAYELGLSIRTVESYRAHLLMKIGVRGTAGAVRLALAAGLMC